MGYIKHISITAFWIGLAFSCVEPYDIRSIDFEEAIVVEGRLTDEQKAHHVRLSYTRSLDEKERVPLANAAVWVENSDGTRIDFKESEPGVYKSDEGVAGVAGKHYQLFFTTQEKKHYKSTVQVLLASPRIASIYGVYAEKASKTSAELKKGIQFFIDTYDETNKAQYFRYEWEETYEVRAHYPSYYEYLTNPDTAVARLEDTSPCYASSKSIAINVGTTANLTEGRLSEMPIRFITHETDHLRFAYSILVRQYAVSAEAYSFYRKILENNHDNGSLFDKQLGVVVGNIAAVADPEETVLGFFEVSGEAEQRAFFKYEDLDKRFPLPKQEHPCQSLYNIHTVDSLEYYVIGKGYAIVSAEYKDGEFNGTLAPRFCTDCRFRGPAIKPDFWIY